MGAIWTYVGRAFKEEDQPVQGPAIGGPGVFRKSEGAMAAGVE